MFFRKKNVKSNIKQVISVTYMCDLKGICMISTRRQQHLVPHTNTLGNLWKSSKHLWDVLVMFRTVGTSSKLNWKPGGVTPIYYLYGYVPPNGVLILKLVIQNRVSISEAFSRTGEKKLWITALSSACLSSACSILLLIMKKHLFDV